MNEAVAKELLCHVRKSCALSLAPPFRPLFRASYSPTYSPPPFRRPPETSKRQFAAWPPK